jgi:putative phage-type endonuclease
MITDKQRETRKLGIGGSDLPIIMGLSNYKTPYQLYLEKLGDINSENETSESQYWGNALEPVIREEFQKRNNVTVETPDTIHHPFYDFMLGNLDGFIPEWNAVLEIKCSSSFMAHEFGENNSDKIPFQYLLQVAHYCAITNADYAYIAVLLGGNEYRQFKYTRDLNIEETIIAEAKKFWECVKTRTPPPPVKQIDLRLMFPKHDPEKVKQVEPDISEQLTLLNETRFKIKSLNDVEEKYKFNVMQFMQDAECLVNENGQPLVSWKANKNGSRTFLVKQGK